MVEAGHLHRRLLLKANRTALQRDRWQRSVLVYRLITGYSRRGRIYFATGVSLQEI